MSALLAKFMAQTRIQVDPALAQRWDRDVRYKGEQPIKQQIAQAKRTATALQKASAQFCNIRPEQELALMAATSAMRALVAELVPMVPWAKAYKVFCDAEYKRERLDALEAIAAARWGDDASALQFEVDLVHELASQEGKLAFAQWLHSMGEHTDVAPENISCCMDKVQSGNTLRERMAATVNEEMRSTDNKWNAMRGTTVICGWRTYERYLAHRKDVAAKARGILKSFTV